MADGEHNKTKSGSERRQSAMGSRSSPPTGLPRRAPPLMNDDIFYHDHDTGAKNLRHAGCCPSLGAALCLPSSSGRCTEGMAMPTTKVHTPVNFREGLCHMLELKLKILTISGLKIPPVPDFSPPVAFGRAGIKHSCEVKTALQKRNPSWPKLHSERVLPRNLLQRRTTA